MKAYFILGYLGSGKTTYVKNLLKRLEGTKTALLVNDFGEIDVDGKKLGEFSPFVLAGGSLFCSCKSDKFVELMSKIGKMPFDNVVIESSGFSNPFNLNKLIYLVNDRFKINFQIGETVTLVDATSFEKVLSTVKMVKMQVAFADVILLNKSDLAAKTDIGRVCSLLREINEDARVEVTQNAERNNYEERLIEKKIPVFLEDLSLQKLVLKVNPMVSISKVSEFCVKASEFCHRIKGTLDLVDFKGSYQFSFSLEDKKDGDGDNLLVFLTASNKSLKKQINALLENNEIGKLM